MSRDSQPRGRIGQALPRRSAWVARFATSFSSLLLLAILLDLILPSRSLQPNPSFQPHKKDTAHNQNSVRRQYRNLDRHEQKHTEVDQISKDMTALRNARNSQDWLHATAVERKFHIAYGSALGPESEFRVVERLRDKRSRSKFASAAVAPKGSEQVRVRVETVEQLRTAILDNNMRLENIDLVQKREAAEDCGAGQEGSVFPHEVVDLIARRFKSGSKPSRRDASDTSHLSLSIEGGGMRGAVPAGMAAAIASLGLCDAFDSVYGSSAGSVIGAYLISRQVDVSIYTDILPAAKESFVSKRRILAGLANDLANVQLNTSNGAMTSADSSNRSNPVGKRVIMPGLNTSYVLDTIMCPNGLRPLNMDAFRKNDVLQPLRVVASSLRQGKMETISFGSHEADFLNESNESLAPQGISTVTADGSRNGLFACLDASMSVPGAAGPPINLIRSRDAEEGSVVSAFDAFCYEPVPYRSAVEEGATHVLALRSRPEGFEIKTKPGFYEKTAASNYFRANGQNEVASFFECGGQQYIYAEDVLTLDEASKSKEAVPVPPPAILYGAPAGQRGDAQKLIDRHDWKRAHLFPIVVPRGTKEMSSLEQREEAVLEAVRGGFAAAYDNLAPAIGVDIDGMDGARVAELFFPTYRFAESALRDPEDSGKTAEKGRSSARKKGAKATVFANPDPRRCQDARTLLAFLPGLQAGLLSHLASGLVYNTR